jgi:predicted nucleotidyltransferase component of viral defense system
MPEPGLPTIHGDPTLFREAVTFTAAETGFSPRLIEKDYFCTLVLWHLTAHAPDLVFKGGTCLAKVHLGFFRLSEDLDFLIPMPVTAPRSARSRQVRATKRTFDEIGERVPDLRVRGRLAGANESKQYIGDLVYESRLERHEETIKVEIGLREPLLTPAIRGHARTLLMDPIGGGSMVAAFGLRCLSWEESMAEKLRAALSRREPAIRDFFDIDHAMRQQGLAVLDAAFVRLVREKLTVPGNRLAPISAERLADLEAQVGSRLRPVLRDRDFRGFDRHALARVWSEVANLAAAVP